MNSKKDKGFTLVELLIVIVILGILATVTVFAVRGITDRGQDNACDVEGRTLSTAIEAYYADNQSDPTTVASLSPAYLKKAPDTAKWTFSTSTPAVVASNGPDGVSGTADDIAAAPARGASFTGIGKCAGF
jgi:general secretion pathway protein G